MLSIDRLKSKKDLCIMQINARELNGIFQIECHTSSIRFLWMIIVSISLPIIAFGIWTAKGDLFNLSQYVTSKYFEIALAIIFLLVVLAFIVIGLIKIIKKPGIFFTGVRVVSNGVEIGVLTLDVNSVSPKEIWENKFIANDVFGEWKQERNFKNKVVNILIVLGKRHELSKRFLLDRIVFSSRDECLFEMFGHNSAGTRWNDIVAISQGAFHLLGNDEGIHPDDLLSFREQTADIVSKWKYSFGLSCVLKTIQSLANLDNVLAFGVLGGIGLTSVKSINDKESIEKIFDNLNNEKNSSVNFDQD